MFSKLLKVVEANPETEIFRISLEGVRRTDASFPRESVVELARRYREHRGFCLVGVQDEDLLDNWDAAALKRDQPIIAWKDEKHRILGPQPSRGNKELLELVLSNRSVSASNAAKRLNLKLNNASTKLKQLLEQGFILRNEVAAPSGGVEFTYYRIH